MDVNSTHTYITPGEYTITISGLYEALITGSPGVVDNNPTGVYNLSQKIIKVDSWGDTGLKQIGFYDSLNLISLPVDGTTLFDIGSFSYVFSGCSSLASIPTGLFDNCINTTNFNEVFSGCSSLASIPNGLFDNNVNATNFNGVFYECINLTTIPNGLFDNNVNAINFNTAFYRCASINSTVPELWISHSTASSEDCYNGCINAINYGDIPFDYLH